MKQRVCVRWLCMLVMMASDDVVGRNKHNILGQKDFDFMNHRLHKPFGQRMYNHIMWS